MDLTRFLSNRKPAASDSGARTKMIVGLGNPGPEYAGQSPQYRVPGG